MTQTINRQIKDEGIIETVLSENERKANSFNYYAHSGLMCVLIVFLVGYGMFAAPEDFILSRNICTSGLLINLIALACCTIMGLNSPTLKYILTALWAIFASVIAGLAGANETFILFFPIVLSVRYFQPKLSIITFCLMLPMAILAQVINITWGYPDVTLLALPEGMTFTWDSNIDITLMNANPDWFGTFLHHLAWQVPTTMVGLVVYGMLLVSTAQVGRWIMIKQAQRNLEERLEQVDKFKSSIVSTLLHVDDNSKVVSYVCNQLKQFVQPENVCVHQYEEPQMYWDANGVCKSVKECCKNCVVFSNGGKAAYDEDGIITYKNLHCPDSIAPKECPGTSILSCLLKVRGRNWGVISLYYQNETHDFTQNERYILKNTAELLTSTLERNLINEDLRKERDNAIAAEHSKSLFFATVSHDIRTPLNAILGFAELLRMGGEDEKTRKQYLESISFSGSTLLQLLNDVLDLSKLEAGKMNFQKEQCDFRKLGDQILSVFKTQADKKELSLKTNYIGDFPSVIVPTQRIRQILFNLLGNAVKFTEKGSISLQAEFIADNDSSGTLVFSVTDTGCGIPEDVIGKLAQPFVQARLEDQTTGTGLGLAICNSMLRQMNGKMTITSKVCEGSIFKVTLKNVGYTYLPVSDSEAKSELQVSAMHNTEDHELPVLVVDDSKVNISVLSAMLKRIGVRHIVTAENGKEALDCLSHCKCSFVFTDLWMPEMNGIELVSAIRKTSGLEKLPVVLITADVEAPQNENRKLFTSTILKPITVEKLANSMKLQ